MEEEKNTTTDYAFAAFLTHIKKMPYVTAVKVRRGKMVYSWDMPQTEWVNYRLEFGQSMFPGYLQEIKLLKDPSF